MHVKFLKGITAGHLPQYLAYHLQVGDVAEVYILRWNQDIANYIQSCEDIGEYSFSGVIKTLIEFGFSKVKTLNSLGEFTVKGDAISFWQPGFTNPIRFSYFGETLEYIETFDLLTGRKLTRYQNMFSFNLNKLHSRSDWENISVFEPKSAEVAKNGIILGTELTVLLASLETAEALEIATNKAIRYEFIAFDYASPALYFKNFSLLEADAERYQQLGYTVRIVTKHAGELPTALTSYLLPKNQEQLPGVPLLSVREIETGIISAQAKVVVITDRELFGTIFVSSRRNSKLKSTEAQKLLAQLEGEIEVGDYIVHEDYGVGTYRGFVVENNEDYLQVEYAAEDELLVPLSQVNKLTKYIADAGQIPTITRLGKTDWEVLRKKVKAQVAIAAEELARHYAQINLATALPVEAVDSESYQGFVEAFVYNPTPDQLSAERDIIKDLAKRKPMHRLLVGDVGYGKTEVIMRATYKACEVDSQVVIFCPTTVLALQHYRSFKARFEHTPYNVCLVSRFNSQQENRQILEDITAGKYDIVIGTHRLLSANFLPKRLGLLVVDEEQRFGVKQKEKLRQLEYGVHTLYVSATPIPRTLSMALAAIQDISMIQTPPVGRKSVETHVEKFSWNRVIMAVSAEISRGGQVFFLHNMIETIDSIRSQLASYLPNVRFAIAHGRMASHKLDEIITDFYERKYDVLICTTIIENGVDMANVNTIVVNNAQRLGLAQMYQLRGRVGRSERQAFAYFLYHGRDIQALDEIAEANTAENVSEAEKKAKLRPAKYLARLETILSAQSLGSGFLVASRDLEIRGAGNLLGREQHGTISKIGYGLYMQMLAEEIERLKNIQETARTISTLSPETL